MAANEPAKAPPLYEAGAGQVNRSASLTALRERARGPAHGYCNPSTRILLLAAVAHPARPIGAHAASRPRRPRPSVQLRRKGRPGRFQLSPGRPRLPQSPQLVARFRADIDKQWKDALAAGARRHARTRDKEAIALPRPSARPSTGSPPASRARLLSLEGEGQLLHRRRACQSRRRARLLWDRRDAAPKSRSPTLLANPAELAGLLTQRWCDALEQGREAKRRGAPAAPDALFDDCPKLSEVDDRPDRHGRQWPVRPAPLSSPIPMSPVLMSRESTRSTLPVTADLSSAL